MKKILLLICCLGLFITGCNSYKRIGRFNMISNRNVDSKGDYILLKPYSSGDDKEKKKSRFTTIEDAIDNTVKLVGGGEFLKNVKVYSVNNKYFAVEGDVWGFRNYETPNVDYKGFKVNDRVQWKEGFSTKTGTIISINVNDNEYCVINNDKNNKAEKVKYADLIPLGDNSQYNNVSEKKSPFGERKNPFEKNKTETKVEETPINKPIFKVGDYVAFKDETTGNYLKGEISTISQNVAFVEYADPNNPSKTKEVGKDVSQLTKIEKPIKETPVIEKKSIMIGDYVLFKKFEDGPALKGRVTQINQNTATVEYTDPNNSKTKEIELDIQKLTKTDN